MYLINIYGLRCDELGKRRKVTCQMAYNEIV